MVMDTGTRGITDLEAEWAEGIHHALRSGSPVVGFRYSDCETQRGRVARDEGVEFRVHDTKLQRT